MKLSPADEDLPCKPLDAESRVAKMSFDRASRLGQEGVFEGLDGHLSGPEGNQGAVFCLQPSPDLDEIPDPHHEFLGIERLGKIIVGSVIEAPKLLVPFGKGSQQDHRYVARPLVLFHGPAEIVSVQSRHHHVADDDVRDLLLSLDQSLPSVGGFQHDEFPGQPGSDECPCILVVFSDEDDGAIRLNRFLRRGPICDDRCRREIGGRRRSGNDIGGIVPVQRKSDAHCRPGSTLASHVDRSAVDRHQFLRQRQSDPRPLGLMCRVGTVESVEDARKVLLGNPDASINDMNGEHPFLFEHGHVDRPAGFGVLDGVRQHILEDVLDLLRIDISFDGLRWTGISKSDALAGRWTGEHAGNTPDQQVHGLPRDAEPKGACLNAGELEQQLDEAEETPGIALDEPQLFLIRRFGKSSPEGIDRAEDERQRGPELMRHVRQKARFRLVDLGEL